MCGIVGLIKKQSLNKIDILNIKNLSSKLKHRGPDDVGEFSDPNIIFSMRRLSIIGLKNGHQPLISNDKNTILIINGEIYNYIELKNRLRTKYSFKTDSDSEVILALYSLYGKKFINYLRGMFAFALYDKKKKLILIGRDRIGEKPLYYSKNKGKLIFSSELRNILSHPEIKKDLDPDAVNQYFHFGYSVAPRTIFKNIRQIEPGTVIEIKLKKLDIKIHKYWTINKVINKKKYYFRNNIVNEIFNSLKYSTRSEVKSGLAFSSGIDSSTILKGIEENNVKVNLISIIYKKFKTLDFQNIKKFIKNKNKKKNIDLINIPDTKMIKNFKEMVIARDEPISDISGSSYYEIMKHAKTKKIKVIFLGHGGDELFWGYKWFNQAAKITQLLKKNKIFAFFYIWYCQINKITNIRSLIKFVINLFDLKLVFNILKLDKCTYENNHEYQLFKKLKNKNFFNKSFFKKIQYQDPCLEIYKSLKKIKNDRVFHLAFMLKTYLHTNGIAQNDRLAMSQGIESRLPLIDYKVVECVINHELFTHSNNNFSRDEIIKKLIKRINFQENYIKKGFEVPNDWTSIIYDKYKNLLNDGMLKKLGIVNKNYKNFDKIALKSIILEIWLRDVFKKKILCN